MKVECEHIVGTTKNIHVKVFFGLIKKRVPLFVCDSCGEIMTIEEMLEDDDYDIAVMSFEDES